MQRFFIEPGGMRHDEVHFDGDTSRQITRVLRLKPGDEVIVLDNTGMEFIVRLTEVNTKDTTAAVLDSRVCPNEPRTCLTMLLCLSQREKFEWMLQKCTELGASEFVPLISSRTLVQRGDERWDKQPRWRKILQEAAEQSRRGVIPTLHPVTKLKNALDETDREDALRLMLWEGEVQQSLKSRLREYKGSRVHVLVGPEGGFSREEVEQARMKGFIPVSLGARILRMETAAISAAALVIHELG